MHYHRFQTRLATRRLLRDGTIEGTPLTEAEKGGCRALLQYDRDGEALADAVAEDLTNTHAAQMGGSVTDFFQWIMDHADQIVAAIMKFLPLILTVVGS